MYDNVKELVVYILYVSIQPDRQFIKEHVPDLLMNILNGKGNDSIEERPFNKPD